MPEYDVVAPESCATNIGIHINTFRNLNLNFKFELVTKTKIDTLIQIARTI